MSDPLPYESLNKDVRDWAKHQSVRMARLVGSLTLKDKIAVYKAVRAAIKNDQYKPLTTSIGASIKKEFGQVNRVNFKFAKQGIYLEHGVGKGRRVRSSNARPKPWLFPILDPAIDELADIIASNEADVVTGEIKFFIPGIISRNVKITNNG